MAKAFAYTRVSTIKQEMTPEEQKLRCKDYYESFLSKDFEWGGVFHDQGVSASKFQWQDRPEGGRLLASVQRGDIIITPMTDRLFRSTLDQAKSCQFLDQIGVGIAILNLNVDTTTPAGRFALTILTANAELETAIRSERMKMAHCTRRRRRSVRKTSPPPGYYFSRKRGQLFPDPQERKLLEQIFRWNDLGVQSVKKTCAWLREHGIKRRSGHYYRSDWVYQSRPCIENNWPLEGYVRRWWKERGDEYRAYKQSRIDRLTKSEKLTREAMRALREMQPDALRAAMLQEPEPISGEGFPSTDWPDDPDES